MLSLLHIENIAVIRTLDVDFTDGLCVITGETGAGKSVMIDCLGLITGGDLRLCAYAQATARIQMERIMKKL